MKALTQAPPQADAEKAPSPARSRAQAVRAEGIDRSHARPAPPIQAKAVVETGYGDLLTAARSTAHQPAETGMPAPVRSKMETSLGADFSDVRVHTGSARAVELGAQAFTQGSEIHVAPGRWAPETAKGQELLGHELGHVLQQRAGRVRETAQLKGTGINQESALEAEADALGERAARGEPARARAPLAQSESSSRQAVVQRKSEADDAKLLGRQAAFKGSDDEIPALEGTLLATRLTALQQGLLSRASYDAGLALSQRMTQIQPAVKAKAPVDADLQARAALAAEQLYAALKQETADDKSFDTLPQATMAGGPPVMAPVVSSTNRYTGEGRSTTVFFVFAIRNQFDGWLKQLPDLVRSGKWEEAFRGYNQLMYGLDLWVADQLRAKGKGTPEEQLGNAQQHYRQLRIGLEEIADKHPSRLPALFHPDPATVQKEKAAGRPAADTVPMQVYFWKDAGDGKYHLYDLTTPGRPHEQPIDGEPTAAAMSTFFEEVARYPLGEVKFQLPNGKTGVAPTSGKTKWYEWAGYAGLAIAVVGLAVLTAGASVPATVCFATGAILSGVAAAGHLADTAQQGTATTASVVLDVAQIAASVASFGAATISIRAAGAAAALANSRYFVPLLGTAAGADVVQLIALSDIGYTELQKVQRSGGSPEDVRRATSVLITQLIVTGGLTVLSVKGASNARSLSGKNLELFEKGGELRLRIAGDVVPAETPVKPGQPNKPGATAEAFAYDEATRKLARESGLQLDEAYAVSQALGKNSVPVEGTKILGEDAIARHFGVKRNDYKLPEAIVVRNDGKFYMVEVKNQNEVAIGDAMAKFRDTSKLITAKYGAYRVGRFELYVKQGFRSFSDRLYSVGKDGVLLYNGAEVKINGVSVYVRELNMGSPGAE